MGQVAEVLALVPPEDVPEVWPRVRPWLDDAARHSGGRALADDYYDDLTGGKSNLFVGEDLAVIGTINRYKRRKMYLVVALGGRSHMLRDWSGMTRTVQQASRALGCDGVEAYGRPGWRANARVAGWRHVLDVWEIDNGR